MFSFEHLLLFFVVKKYFIFQTIVFHFPARSGSTLLCQIFAKLPKTLVLSDPYVWAYLLRAYRVGEVTRAQTKQLIKSTVPLILKKHVSVKYL